VTVCNSNRSFAQTVNYITSCKRFIKHLVTTERMHYLTACTLLVRFLYSAWQFIVGLCEIIQSNYLYWRLPISAYSEHTTVSQSKQPTAAKQKYVKFYLYTISATKYGNISSVNTFTVNLYRRELECVNRQLFECGSTTTMCLTKYLDHWYQ